jgi:hypothetical protein
LRLRHAKTLQAKFDSMKVGPNKEMADQLHDAFFATKVPDAFYQISAQKLLFDGYSDSLIDHLSDLLAMQDSKDLWGMPFLNGQFMLMLGRNKTRNQTLYQDVETDFSFKMDTGSVNSNRAWYMLEWNKKNKVTCWTDNCAKIEGFEGSYFPLPIDRSKSLSVFTTELYR